MTSCHEDAAIRSGEHCVSIPGFQTIMRPLLEFAARPGEHTLTEAKEHLATHFSLSDAELAAMLPSGRAPTFYNRIAWAKTYLQQARLLDSPRRGRFAVSTRGREVLESPPERITISFLEQFPEFREFRHSRKKEVEAKSASDGNDLNSSSSSCS